MRFGLLLGFLLLSWNAVAAPTLHHQDCSWPLRFFAGVSTGSGSLGLPFLPARSIHVRSRGTIGKDGSLVLQQTIRQGTQAPHAREWWLRQTSACRYAGTLTDAVGPVTGEVKGDLLHLRYTMKGVWRIRIEQWLERQSDGRTLRNQLLATKLGLPIAAASETIRKRR